MERTIEPIAPAGLHEKVFEILAALPGTEVLDAPAGHGALAGRLSSIGKSVTAGDIDIGKFRAGESPGSLRLVRLDLDDPVLPFPDGHFDAVACVEGIEHLQSQWNLIRNFHRVLKPGGHLVVTTPNILNIRSRLRFLLEGRHEHFKRPLVRGRSWSHDLENRHISPVSYFELQFMLESCGFSILGVHTNRYRGKNRLTRLLKPLYRAIYWDKNRRDRRRNRGDHGPLYQVIVSDELLFGECLVVLARNEGAAGGSIRPVGPC